MTRKGTMLLVLMAILNCMVTAEPSQAVSIYHRLIGPSNSHSELPAWTKRGSWSGTSWSTESDAFTALPETGKSYQIGFGQSSEEVKNFVSVPECYLHSLSTKPLQDTLVLVMPSKSSNNPIHLRYAIHGADYTRCQPGNRATSFNTTVKIEYPENIDGPRLHQPVVVVYQEDGTVKQPEPEKSFLQKYWIYLLPVALLVLTSGAGGN